MKEVCDALAWDMINLGLILRWKEHQSAESSAHILLMNVPPVLEWGGMENVIVWHLCKLETREEITQEKGSSQKSSLESHFPQ
jgi:hypothetical protein